MSMPRYKVMESAEMISAFRRGASSRARADFPDAVGPVRMRALANGEGVTRCISIEVGRICNPSRTSQRRDYKSVLRVLASRQLAKVVHEERPRPPNRLLAPKELQHNGHLRRQP